MNDAQKKSLELAVFQNEDGWAGVFTRYQCDGAIPNGTVIEKATFEEGDFAPLGTLGTVLGSVYHEEIGYFYFVEWSIQPKMAVGLMALKIARAGSTKEHTQN